MQYSIRKRIDKLRKELDKQLTDRQSFKVYFKDGTSQITDFYTAFDFAIALPSTAIRIEEIQPTGKGELCGLLNCLLEDFENIEQTKDKE